MVLTSRPSALKLMPPPEGLVTVNLCGFSESQIRDLAERLVSFRLGVSDSGVLLSEATPAVGHESKVEQLLRDCRENRGIGRLAQNPFLLTLLLIVYLNESPLSARRHHIYGEAVRTFATQRNRRKGVEHVSEVDLRRRLSALAVQMLERPEGGMATQAVVEELFRKIMAEETRSPTTRADGVAFLRLVEDATGLLVLHGNPNGPTAREPLVTFMHYSFLEYFAAVGLAMEGNKAKILERARRYRWYAIATLAIAVLSDTEGLTGSVETLLSSVTPEDEITGFPLLMAFDCVHEATDVPDVARRLLVAKTGEMLRTGKAAADPDFRTAIADGLGELWAITGSPAVIDLLVGGLCDQDDRICAITMDIVGKVGADVELPGAVRDAFSKACKRSSQTILSAGVSAMVRCVQLRRDESIALLRRALRGKMLGRISALRELKGAPELGSRVLDDIREGLRTNNSLVAGLAGRAELACYAAQGAQLRLHDLDTRSGLLRCLEAWERIASSSDAEGYSLRVEADDVVRLLDGTEDERLLGIRLLPWVTHKDSWIYEQIRQNALYDAAPRQQAAGLHTIAMRRGLAQLLSEADLDRIAGLLDDHTRDVRLAATRALSAFGSGPRIIVLLRERIAAPLKSTADLGEFRERAYALARIANNDESARLFLESEILRGMKVVGDGSGRRTLEHTRLVVLLRSAQEFDGEWDEHLVRGLRVLAQGHRVPDRLRRECLMAYGRMASPSDSFTQLIADYLRRVDYFETASYAAEAFARRCRLEYAFARRAEPQLRQIGRALVDAASRFSSTYRDEVDSPVLRSIRATLLLIDETIQAADEFRKNSRVQPA